MIIKRELRKAKVSIITFQNGETSTESIVLEIPPKTKSIENFCRKKYGKNIIVDINEEYTEELIYDVPLEILENYKKN